MTDRPPEPNDLLTVHDIVARLQLSRATVYRYVDEGLFPAPLRLGGGATRWVRGEVDAWQAELAAQRVGKGS